MDPLTALGVSAWTGYISGAICVLAIAGWALYQARAYVLARKASSKTK